MDKYLHIVCHNVPYPADYGGVYDLFYKIKYLSLSNVRIILHCFDYGRGRQDELNKYCHEVYYYKRKNILKSSFSSIPYIVNSRNNKELLNRLLMDSHPVLLEGIHCTYFLNNNLLLKRKVFVRLHNVEYKYYEKLAIAERSWFKKCYLKIESRLLKKYEKSICNKATFLPVSKDDLDIYKEMGGVNLFYLPVFLPFEKVSSYEGKNSFCLYHGDLSVAENEKAVIWLINIFNQINIPFVIAGKSPSKRMQHFAERNENICVIADPGEQEMSDLISKAQINVIPSFNSTGIKIKLLNSLFNGRHCIVNSSTIGDTGLKKLCHVCEDEKCFIDKIVKLIDKEFTIEDIRERENFLMTNYNHYRNTLQLIQMIW